MQVYLKNHCTFVFNNFICKLWQTICILRHSDELCIKIDVNWISMHLCCFFLSRRSGSLNGSGCVARQNKKNCCMRKKGSARPQIYPRLWNSNSRRKAQKTSPKQFFATKQLFRNNQQYLKLYYSPSMHRSGKFQKSVCKMVLLIEFAQTAFVEFNESWPNLKVMWWLG